MHYQLAIATLQRFRLSQYQLCASPSTSELKAREMPMHNDNGHEVKSGWAVKADGRRIKQAFTLTTVR